MFIPSSIIKRTNIRTEKMLFFYLCGTMWVFAYTILAFSIAIFLKEELGNVMFVGIFMGIASILGLFMDIVFGYLQTIIRPRKLIIASIVSLIITIGIFLLSKGIIFLIFIAVITYALSHDLYDITMMGYILKNSLTEEYSQSISQKNVSEALGALAGLVVSGILLAFGSTTAQISLEIILFIVLIYVLSHFDKEKYDKPINLNEISSIEQLPSYIRETLSNPKKTFGELGNKIRIAVTSEINASKRIAKKQTAGFLKRLAARIEMSEEEKKRREHLRLLQQMQMHPKKKFVFREMYQELIEAFEGVLGIFYQKKINIPLIWATGILMIFSFWDTFVLTFQPLFLAQVNISELPNSIKPMAGGIIMALMIIPLFVFQVPFSKLSDKYGRHNFIILGLIISGISIFFFGRVNSISALIIVGICNSIGYAAAMPSIQGMFAGKFQENFKALHSKEKTDNNLSSAPLKLINNFGNIFGTLIGGILISILGFSVFFMVFGSLILIIVIFSIISYKLISQKRFVTQQYNLGN